MQDVKISDIVRVHEECKKLLEQLNDKRQELYDLGVTNHIETNGINRVCIGRNPFIRYHIKATMEL